MTVTLSVAGSELRQLQKRRKLVLLAVIWLFVVLLLLTRSRWIEEAPNLYALIKQTGIALILLCVLGRTWCTLYIGGHKKRALITCGPYSLARNPLYLFTSIGAAGAGAQAGSLAALALAGAATLAVFHLVVRREEAFLMETFPAEYAAYRARVPRYLPRLAWRDADELIIKPRLVLRTFFDGLLMLAAAPIAEAIGWLHSDGCLLLASLP